MKYASFIVLAIGLTAVAHAVNVPTPASTVKLEGGYCFDPATTSGAAPNPDNRRAAQNCFGQLAGGGFYEISVVVDNFNHAAPDYVIDQITVLLFHVPTLDSGSNVYYWDGAITAPPGNSTASQWEEANSGTTATLYGTKFNGVGTGGAAFCIDFTTAAQGIHFTSKSNQQFRTWSVDPGQTLTFVSC